VTGGPPAAAAGPPGEWPHSLSHGARVLYDPLLKMAHVSDRGDTIMIHGVVRPPSCCHHGDESDVGLSHVSGSGSPA
jgi:hypothetical protein